MTAFLAEACIQISNASPLIDFICDRLARLCTMVPDQGRDTILVFEAGRAILRDAQRALLMRVEAENIVACHFIKIALEGNIFETGTIREGAVLWVPGREEPFLALENCVNLKGESEPDDDGK